MTSTVADEQTAKLLEAEAREKQDQSTDRNIDDLQNDLDMRPSSSRVKKVLTWNSSTQQFEIEEKHKRELREVHITKQEDWADFERFYQELPIGIHPQVKRPSCCKALVLYFLAFVFLLLFAYTFFIILQLALFNLIMLVVMSVWWWKLLKICRAVIGRILDNGRKSAFKSYVKKMKDAEWLKALNIDIQENDEGKWIEIHLNDGADKDEDLLLEEDED